MSSGDNSQGKDPAAIALQAAYQDTVDEGVPENLRKLIDDNLKRAFDDTVEEGVPDRFKTLIDALRVAAETKQ